MTKGKQHSPIWPTAGTGDGFSTCWLMTHSRDLEEGKRLTVVVATARLYFSLELLSRLPSSQSCGREMGAPVQR